MLLQRVVFALQIIEFLFRLPECHSPKKSKLKSRTLRGHIGTFGGHNGTFRGQKQKGTFGGQIETFGGHNGTLGGSKLDIWGPNWDI